MAHRGRLNVLTTVFKKSYTELFAEFEGIYTKDSPKYKLPYFFGDVKYHNGTSNQIKNSKNKPLNLYLLPNPSHLEAINGVLYGALSAIENHDKTLSIIIHGDSAVSGLGINYEV